MAARLRRETTLPLKWIAARLQMGTWKSTKSKLHGWMRAHDKTPQAKAMVSFSFGGRLRRRSVQPGALIEQEVQKDLSRDRRARGSLHELRHDLSREPARQDAVVRRDRPHGSTVQELAPGIEQVFVVLREPGSPQVGSDTGRHPLRSRWAFVAIWLGSSGSVVVAPRTESGLNRRDVRQEFVHVFGEKGANEEVRNRRLKQRRSAGLHDSRPTAVVEAA
jgi:hypothetical protein